MLWVFQFHRKWLGSHCLLNRQSQSKSCEQWSSCLCICGYIKQQRRRGKGKRFLKSEFALWQTSSLPAILSNSTSFNLSNVGEFFWNWIVRGSISISIWKRTAENRSVVSTFSIKREVSKFDVKVVKRRQGNVQKAWCTCKVACLIASKPWFFAVVVVVAVIVA